MASVRSDAEGQGPFAVSLLQQGILSQLEALTPQSGKNNSSLQQQNE